MAQKGPRKIAVLGSGVGSMAAVFALTSRPDWRDDYEITVYQMGWRLGGKGAAGRNAKYGDRIEEHGLHVWLGFYDNAFRMMRQCYEELDRPPGVPIRTWTDAFTPYDTAILAEYVNQRWIPWHMELPTNGRTPGDPHETLSAWDYVEMLLQWLLESIVGPNHEAALRKMFEFRGEKSPESEEALGYVRGQEPGAGSQGTGGIGPEAQPTHGFVAWLVEHLHGAHTIARELPDEVEAHDPAHHDRIIELLEKFLGRLKKAVEGFTEHHDATRRLFILADLSIAGIKGILRENLLRRGFIAADDMEFRAWLGKHGASDLTISSAPVREVYDLAFAYENGDLESPNIAAGTAMLIMLRMAFDYKGSAMYKMTAGMGDTIFAPLYELLKRRGVTFEFFHRVRRLELSEDGRSVARMHVDRQVTLQDPEAGYQPFVDVHGLPCWPSEPLYDQIVEGRELRDGQINLESSWSGWVPAEKRELEAGRDFDQIILGISIAALHSICSDLHEASESWRAMLDNVRTVQTQAVQLWLAPTMAELGWTGSVPMIGTWAEPLDTMADMSELLPAENWPADDAPKTILYLCGPKYSRDEPPESDTGYPRRQLENVRQTAITWLSSNPAAMLPGGASLTNPAGLDFGHLHVVDDAAGVARFDQQYVRANVDPTERYVLSVAGSTKHRLGAGESGFDNLVLAGDWVFSGLNAGSVEAAAMAGLSAANAISGDDVPIAGWRRDDE